MSGRAWAVLSLVVRGSITGSLIGLTVSDRYFTLAPVHGASMLPTFEGRTGEREYALVKRSPERYDYSRGEVVIFVSPVDHRSKAIKRVIGMPGDWISLPETEEIRKIPAGHCWVEGDNGSVSRDSRAYGPINIRPILDYEECMRRNSFRLNTELAQCKPHRLIGLRRTKQMCKHTGYMSSGRLLLKYGVPYQHEYQDDLSRAL